MNYEFIKFNRRLCNLEFDGLIGLYLRFLAVEKKIVDPEKCNQKRNQLHNEICSWLQSQGFRIGYQSDDDEENRYDTQLWHMIMGNENENHLNFRFSAFSNDLLKFYQLKRFDQVSQLSNCLRKIHSIVYSQTRYFSKKQPMKCLIEYLIKLVVMHTLKENVYKKRIKSSLGIVPIALMNIILDYYD